MLLLKIVKIHEKMIESETGKFYNLDLFCFPCFVR